MDLFAKYYNKALRFLSFRPRSEKEVRDNLNKKSRRSRKKVEEVDQGVVDKVIAKLKEQRFLNDEEFTRWWIEQRTKFQKKSLKIIKFELIKKGINKEMIETIIQNAGSEVQNDLERARELVRKKIPKYKSLNIQEMYQKLGGFLARRGFDWDTIKQSIDEVLKEGV